MQFTFKLMDDNGALGVVVKVFPEFFGVLTGANKLMVFGLFGS